MVYNAGKKFSEIGLLFKDPEKIDDVEEKIKIASDKFRELADLEEEIYSFLETNI